MDANAFHAVLESARLPQAAQTPHTVPLIISEDAARITTTAQPDDLTSVLHTLGLPPFLPNEPLRASVEKLAAAYAVLRDSGHEEALAACAPVDCVSILEQLTVFEHHTELAAACDAQEVELANLQVSENPRFSGLSDADLRALADELHDAVELARDAVPVGQAVAALASGGDEALNFLEAWREDTRGAYWKTRAAEALHGRTEDWARILAVLVRDGEAQLDALGAALGLDRIATLKMTYALCARGLVEYDRHADVLHLPR